MRFADSLNYIVSALKAFADQAAQIFIGVVSMMKRSLTGGDVEAAYNQMLGRLEAITVSRGNELAGIWQGIVNRITSVFGGGAAPAAGGFNLNIDDYPGDKYKAPGPKARVKQAKKRRITPTI